MSCVGPFQCFRDEVTFLPFVKSVSQKNPNLSRRKAIQRKLAKECKIEFRVNRDVDYERHLMYGKFEANDQQLINAVMRPSKNKKFSYVNPIIKFDGKTPIYEGNDSFIDMSSDLSSVESNDWCDRSWGSIPNDYDSDGSFGEMIE